MYFSIDEVIVPISSILEFNQVYEHIGGSHLIRTQSGRAIKQTHFRKLKSIISAKGWHPSGLDNLNYSNPLVLKCAVPLSISSKLNQIELICNWRNDLGYVPKGYAIIDGHLVETALNIYECLGVLEQVQNALFYQIHYYPELLVFSEPPQIHGNVTGAELSWTLTCEEV